MSNTGAPETATINSAMQPAAGDATSPAVMPREKYRVAPRAKSPIEAHEIRVSTEGTVMNYAAYAAKLMTEQNQDKVTFKATGYAVSKAISAAEVTRRRFVGLHQVCKINMVTISDRYEPLEEGLTALVKERDVPSIEITLTRNEALIDKTEPGYQAPLPESEIAPYDPTAPKTRELRNFSRGGRGGHRGGARAPRNNAAVQAAVENGSQQQRRGRGGFRGGRNIGRGGGMPL